MKVLIIAGAALTAIISATVFAGNHTDQAVDTTVVEAMNLEASTLTESPCNTAVLQFTGDIVLEKASKTEFTHFCTDRMFQRATKIPKEEFIWAIYDMQRAAGRALTPLARLTVTFDKIDKDGDLAINMKELNAYTSRLTAPVLGAAGCGTCGQGQPGCSVGCHCHNAGDCGKDGDGSKFSSEGLAPIKQ
jgi:hypothetical protein